MRKRVLLIVMAVVGLVSVFAADPPDQLSRVDGLHVTGRMIEVDIDTYRLSVTGAVREPLSLTMDQITAMESHRIYMVLECPGIFVDQGYWTGVRVADVLDLAGVSTEAVGVIFESIDRTYKTSLPLEVIRRSDVLLAYEFNDKPFPAYHGFPLRVAAKGQAGNRWAKWLGSIEVVVE